MVLLAGTLAFQLVSAFAKIIQENRNDGFLDTLCGNKKNSRDVSCFNKITDSDIHPLNEKTSRSLRNALFFIETSCKGVLTLRQACSVESAAKEHPTRNIVVLFIGPVISECLQTSPMWDLLNFYSNVFFYRIHLHDFLKDTLFSFLFDDKRLIISLLPVREMADILKWATLYKFGGVYLDLDMIITRSLDLLPVKNNFIGKRNLTEFGFAVIALNKDELGSTIAKTVMKIMRQNISNSIFGHNSKDAFMNTMKIVCSTDDTLIMSAATCKGFEIYSPSLFYPISYENWKTFFTSYDSVPQIPYAFHLWDRLSHYESIYDDSLYAELMRSQCPNIFNLTKNE